jgi:hypothetical protein
MYSNRPMVTLVLCHAREGAQNVDNAAITARAGMFHYMGVLETRLATCSEESSLNSVFPVGSLVVELNIKTPVRHFVLWLCDNSNVVSQQPQNLRLTDA